MTGPRTALRSSTGFTAMESKWSFKSAAAALVEDSGTAASPAADWKRRRRFIGRQITGSLSSRRWEARVPCCRHGSWSRSLLQHFDRLLDHLITLRKIFGLRRDLYIRRDSLCLKEAAIRQHGLPRGNHHGHSVREHMRLRIGRSAVGARADEFA